VIAVISWKQVLSRVGYNRNAEFSGGGINLKNFLIMSAFAGAVSFAVAGFSQSAPVAAPAAAAPAAQSQVPTPAAPIPIEKQLATAQAKLQDWAQLAHYRTQNEALAPAAPGEQRVVFFGDSITEIWGHRGSEFFPGKPYINRGISGQTSAQMVVRFHPDVVNLHPKAVVILAGTNDVAANTGPMSPDATLDDFRSMVEMARANHITVIIGSIPPADDFPWRRGLEPAPKIRALNEKLHAYCVSENIPWIDYYSALADEKGAMKPGLSIDGVHPSPAGFAIMAPLAEASIDKALAK
jgi:lysophospholipase L1-like esterase